MQTSILACQEIAKTIQNIMNCMTVVYKPVMN